jgi:hypothetical protein
MNDYDEGYHPSLWDDLKDVLNQLKIEIRYQGIYHKYLTFEDRIRLRKYRFATNEELGHLPILLVNQLIDLKSIESEGDDLIWFRSRYP